MTKSLQTVLDKFLFNWCYLKFVSYIVISDLVTPCMARDLAQHMHFDYLLDVVSFNNPAFYTIQHCEPNRYPVELTF
jgi:hypothetical protein